MVPAGKLAALRYAAVGAALAAGCLNPDSSGECNDDAECSGSDVCARDKMCASASTVRAVTTTWTIRGAAADPTSCAAHPDLFISFIGRDPGDTLGYAPVPCHLGQFFIDRLPDRFRQLEFGVDGGASELRAIGSSNMVAIDLP